MGAQCGTADVCALEWGAEGYEELVASLAPQEWVLAADCCYIDNVSEQGWLERCDRCDSVHTHRCRCSCYLE